MDKQLRKWIDGWIDEYWYIVTSGSWGWFRGQVTVWRFTCSPCVYDRFPPGSHFISLSKNMQVGGLAMANCPLGETRTLHWTSSALCLLNPERFFMLLFDCQVGCAGERKWRKFLKLNTVLMSHHSLLSHLMFSSDATSAKTPFPHGKGKSFCARLLQGLFFTSQHAHSSFTIFPDW